MTNYVFENMTADQAANFTSADTLVFSTATLNPTDVVATSSNNGLDLTTLTAVGKSLVFAGSQLAGADINFTSAFIAGKTDGLFLGSFGDNNDFASITIDNDDNGNVAYGFYGDDNIAGGAGADNIYGGGGGDTLSGNDGNDHLYGFQLSGGTAADDGADTIRGDAGNDYIQGNAGDDSLNGGIGNDRVNGGNGADTIHGDDGNDTINGNKGADSIDGGNGNDSLRGGADDDSMTGGAGNDILLGDLGNDKLVGGTGLDILTGGGGADTFGFFNGDAAFTTTGSLAYFADTITDFTDGTDKIGLENVAATAADVLHAQAGIVLTSVAAALTMRSSCSNAHTGGTDVAALDVGSDTYLFYNGAGSTGSIDSLIKVSGVAAANITIADIIQIGGA